MSENFVGPQGIHAGHVVQSVKAVRTTLLNFAANIGGNVIDDSIPQNTQGVEILTASITPKSATNILRVKSIINFGNNTNTHQVLMLFRDAIPDAIAAAWETGPSTASGGLQLHVEADIVAGSLSLTTFKVHGWASGGTIGVTGNSSTRYLGGVATNYILIEEIKA